jgi:hypothetical protein
MRDHAHKLLDLRVPTLSIECEPCGPRLTILRMSFPRQGSEPAAFCLVDVPYGGEERSHHQWRTGFALSHKGNQHEHRLEKFKMNAKELADKFNAKTGAAVVERARQSGLAAEHIQKRSEDIEHCKRAMESNVCRSSRN